MVVVLALGIISKALSATRFSVGRVVCVAGQIAFAIWHLINIRTFSTQTPNEGQENDGEERSEDGFDD